MNDSQLTPTQLPRFSENLSLSRESISEQEKSPLFPGQLSQFCTWIKNYNNLYKMIPYLKNREFALLEPKHTKHDVPRDTRTLRAHNIQSLQYIMMGLLKVDLNETLYNMYYSTADYVDGVPYTNCELGKRKEHEDFVDWKINYWKSIKEVDFFLDIDSPDHELQNIEIAKQDTLRIIKDFDTRSIFSVRFTGCGFHIVIPQKEMMFRYNVIAESCEPYTLKNIWQEYSEIAKQFSDKYSELIDTQLNDSRRLIKLPYSLSFYEDETYVCCPLTVQQLKDFELKNYTYRGFNG